jgi:hypothetical protein
MSRKLRHTEFSQTFILNKTRELKDAKTLHVIIYQAILAISDF